jgi:hypothetical protein
MTFVLHASIDENGHLRGVVTRVQTGEKERFQGVEALATLVLRMTADGPAGATPGLSGLG